MTDMNTGTTDISVLSSDAMGTRWFSADCNMAIFIVYILSMFGHVFGKSLLGECESDCSFLGADGTLVPCSLKSFSKQDGLAITSSSVDNGNPRLPDGPKDVVIRQEDERTVDITWKQRTVDVQYLRHHLLKVTSRYVNEDGAPMEKTEFFLLSFPNTTFSDSKIDHSTQFGIQCTNPTAEEVVAEVWALPKLPKKVRRRREYRHILHKYSSVSSRRQSLDYEKRMQLKAAEDCFCHSEVQRPIDVRQKHIDEPLVSGLVNITNWPKSGTVVIRLYKVEKPKHKSFKLNSVEENRSLGFTLFSVKSSHLMLGEYYIQVNRHCPQKYSHLLPDTCEARVVRSALIKVKGGAEVEVDWTLDLVKVVYVCIGSASVLFLCACVVRLIRHHVSNSAKASVSEEPPTLLTSDTISPTTQMNLTFNQRKDDKVAVIYTEDCTSHREAVHCLCKMLAEFGIDVSVVDEYSSPQMRKNWIDFTESLVKTHKQVVFVVSWEMYRLCHEYKYGDEASYRSLIDKVKGRCLPVVMLNILSILSIQHVNRKIRTFVVAFSPRREADLLQRFAADHFVVNNGFIYHLLSQIPGQELTVNVDCLADLVCHLRRESDSRQRKSKIMELISTSSSVVDFLSFATANHDSLYTFPTTQGNTEE